MKTWDYLIKPASGRCNLRCRYCFYADETACRAAETPPVMAEDTVRLLIGRAMEAAAPGDALSFAFQGGEPTCAGLAFFEAFVRRVKEQNTAKHPVAYSLQTNGLLLDEAWVHFLKENNFLVGVSLDGTKDLHDQNRVDAGGRGSWTQVLSKIALLQAAAVPTNLLCVVTRQCARSPQKIYRQMKKTGLRHFQFIPCLDPLGEARGNRPWSLRAQDYGSFLIGLFRVWYEDWRSGDYCSIRLFEDYVHLLTGRPAGSCAACGACGSYFVVESDGSLYPCDFYALDEWKLGTLKTAPLARLAAGERATAFLARSREKPAECAACRWQPVCRGGCPRDWQPDAAGAPHNYYCTAFKQFFEACAAPLAQIARAELAAQRAVKNKG